MRNKTKSQSVSGHWKGRSLLSLLPEFLPRLKQIAKGPILRRIYWALMDVWDQDGNAVRTKIHGFDVWVNRGNMYPFFLHGCPQFNAPLVQLVSQMAQTKQRAITLVDVGAATGDTVLLLQERCSWAVNSFICIEGDSEFFGLLTENMRQFDNVECVNTLLARENTKISSLVKQHRGTASATGSEMKEAIPLDDVRVLDGRPIDILKIDVDGFDGEVLAGAVSTLQRCSPAVIFEWHPELIQNVGNDPFRGFRTLQESGYNRFLWFRNDGTFSHFDHSCDPETLELQCRYLLSVSPKTGEHFDVIAIPATTDLDLVALAESHFARSWAERPENDSDKQR